MLGDEDGANIDSHNFWFGPTGNTPHSAEYRRQLRNRNRQVRPRLVPPSIAKPKPFSVLKGLEAAFVLIFNEGQRNEGVYTLQDGKGPSTVLAFESVVDAESFAQQLQAEGMDLATPSHRDADQLTSFCDVAGFEVSIVPQGMTPTPPKKNVYHQGTMGDDVYGRDPGSIRRGDPYLEYRQRLEALFPRKPDNCGDDDCTIGQSMDDWEAHFDEKEVAATSAPPDGFLREDPGLILRAEALAAIDDILAARGGYGMDLTTLMKRAMEKAAEDLQEEQEAEEEADEEGEAGGEGN